MLKYSFLYIFSYFENLFKIKNIKYSLTNKNNYFSLFIIYVIIFLDYLENYLYFINKLNYIFKKLFLRINKKSLLCIETKEKSFIFKCEKFIFENNFLSNILKIKKSLSKKIIIKVELILKNDNILILNNYKKYDVNNNREINKLCYLLINENISHNKLKSINIYYFDNKIDNVTFNINKDLLEKNFVDILNF